MSDETTTTTDGDAEDTGTKKRQRRTLTVLVLRAVDGYHHRGRTLTVPNDEYHRGLLAQGNLREVG